MTARRYPLGARARRIATLCLGLLALGAPAHAARPVVAVFDLESKGAKLKAEELERLADYVSTSLSASRRFEVVPRAELKQALSSQKKASYKACYDESCQIEIGKELAAEKSVAGTISRFGNSCIVTLKLFDLAKSTAEGGGRARGGCSPDDVLTSLERAVDQLAGPIQRAAPAPTPRADYGDLDAERRSARRAAAEADWQRVKPFVADTAVPPKRRIEVLRKFLDTFPDENPREREARAAIARLEAAPAPKPTSGTKPAVSPESRGRVKRLLAALDRNKEKAKAKVGVKILRRVEVGDAPTWGFVAAPVTIVVFGDFQCRYCDRLRETLKAVVKARPAEVKIAFKHFPLASHKDARLAARASMAAHRQGKFWAMHDKLYANQGALKKKHLLKYARQLKLDMPRFRRDLKDPAIDAHVQRDLQQGQTLGVRGTPTTFINGMLMNGNRPKHVIEEYIQDALGK